MPKNYFIFSTGGDWDSTTLFNNGEEYMADRLYLDLKAGRDGYGNYTRGGVTAGGDMTALVVPQGTTQEVGVFPGRIDLEFPTHKVTLENDTPQFAIEFTRILLDGADVTQTTVEFVAEIDSPNNVVRAYLTMFHPHMIAADELTTVNLL